MQIGKPRPHLDLPFLELALLGWNYDLHDDIFFNKDKTISAADAALIEAKVKEIYHEEQSFIDHTRAIEKEINNLEIEKDKKKPD